MVVALWYFMCDIELVDVIATIFLNRRVLPPKPHPPIYLRPDCIDTLILIKEV